MRRYNTLYDLKCDYSVVRNNKFKFNMVLDFDCSCKSTKHNPINNPECKTCKFIVIHTKKSSFKILKGLTSKDFYKPCVFFYVDLDNLKVALPAIRKHIEEKDNTNFTKVIL